MAFSSSSFLFREINPVLSVAGTVCSMAACSQVPVLVPDHAVYPFSAALMKGWEAEEDEGNLYLSVEMPGLGKEHVNVSVEQKTVLVIDGSNKQEPDDQSCSSTTAGTKRTFNFKFHFPKDVFKIDAIKGEMKNGLLELTLPKDIIQV